ncbi:DgyrCDS1704 [Dimorphilus gyrociliatus]|uniref:DgyrCDS1704 n=1 Tax=Dimorphilus gyrociliatus TaxID=2664684 RepID=A0A7I8V883_9ANNE|nr:DgyrCDS1704 [Dimorphilus gyrociliatus]
MAEGGHSNRTHSQLKEEYGRGSKASIRRVSSNKNDISIEKIEPTSSNFGNRPVFQLEDQPHFHYDYSDKCFNHLALVICNNDQDGKKSDLLEDNGKFTIKVTVKDAEMNINVWIVRRSLDDFLALDEAVHKCIWERHSSLLTDLKVLRQYDKNSKSVLQTYLSKFATMAVSGKTVPCSTVLNFFEMDYSGKKLIHARSTLINIPAKACGTVTKPYVKQEFDEISVEVGDMVSIIEMPDSPAHWWRGKRQRDKTVEVGYFPRQCVELLGSKLPESLDNLKNTPIKPVQRSRGKIFAFLLNFFTSRPSRTHLKRKGIVKERVFGCDLGEHVVNVDAKDKIPDIVKCCAEIIEKHGIVDGIYRLSGINSNIQKLRLDFDENRQPDLSKEETLQDIHSISSLLKMYFRELPNPLLTYQLYDQFVDAVKYAQSEEDKPMRISNVVELLPPVHKETARFLFLHLARVASRGYETNMHAKQLSIVWAPNLLRSKRLETPQRCCDMLQDVAVQATITELLINYANQVFGDEKYQDVDGIIKRHRPKSLAVSTPSKYDCRLSADSMLISLEEAKNRKLGRNFEYEKENSRKSKRGNSKSSLFRKSPRSMRSKSSKFTATSDPGKSLTLTAADIPEEWRHHHQPFRLSKSAESLDKCTVFANPSPDIIGLESNENYSKSDNWNSVETKTFKPPPMNRPSIKQANFSLTHHRACSLDSAAIVEPPAEQRSEFFENLNSLEILNSQESLASSVLKGFDETKEDKEFPDYERERTSSFTTFRREQPIYENLQQVKNSHFSSYKQCPRYEKELTEDEFPTATLPEEVEVSQAWSKQLSPSITNSNFSKFEEKNVSVDLITIDESSTDPLSVHIDKFNEISEELERTSNLTSTSDEKEEVPVTIIDEPFPTSDLIMSPAATHRQISRFSLDKTPEEEEKSIVPTSSTCSLNNQTSVNDNHLDDAFTSEKSSPIEDKPIVEAPLTDKVKSLLEERIKSSFEEDVQLSLSLTEKVAESPLKEEVESPLTEKVESPLKEKVESPLKEKVESPLKEKVESPFKEKVESPWEENIIQFGESTPIFRDPVNIKENIELRSPSSSKSNKSIIDSFHEEKKAQTNEKEKSNICYDEMNKNPANVNSEKLFTKIKSTKLPQNDNETVTDKSQGSFVENLKKFDNDKPTFRENNSLENSKQNKNVYFQRRQQFSYENVVKVDKFEKVDVTENESCISATDDKRIDLNLSDSSEQDPITKKRSIKNIGEKADSPILQVARRYSVVESEQVNNLGKVSSSPFLNKQESQDSSQSTVNSPEKKVRLSGSIDSLDEMTIEQLEVKENVPVKVKPSLTSSFSGKASSKPIPKPRRSVESNVARSAPEPEVRKDVIKSHLDSLRSRERPINSGVKQLETKTSSTFSLTTSQKSQERIDITPDTQRKTENLPKFGETSRMFSAKVVKDEKDEKQVAIEGDEENSTNNSSYSSKQGSVRSFLNDKLAKLPFI